MRAVADINRQWLAAGRPAGRALRTEDFALHEAPVRAPERGQVLVKTLYLSFDPALKGWMGGFGALPGEQGPVIYANGLGRVIESASSSFQPGDFVTGVLGWQEFATLEAHELERVENDDLLTANLGVLGTTGLTALLGHKNIGMPMPGDTLVVTGAAGATGSIAGQLGRLAGCRVIGIAGGPEKCAWLRNELKFDATIDYKSEDIRSALASLAPDGIDIIWDNVGGPLLDSLLERINLRGRVVLCGGISRYEQTPPPPGPSNYFNLIIQQSRMQGFIVGNYSNEWPWARARLKQLLRSGAIVHREDIAEGFENAPLALMRIFRGENIGKQLLRLSDD